MSTHTLQIVIKEMRSEIEKRLNSMSNRKDVGMLGIDKSKKVPSFYQVCHDGKKIHLPKTDMESIRALAQSTYEAKLCKCAEQEFIVLGKCLRILEKAKSPEDIYESLPPELKALVNPNSLDDEYARIWQSQKFTRITDDPGDEFETDNGEHVRSKTELYIANRLKALGIPYHYEKPLYLKKTRKKRAPDFTILNKRTRKVYYWEHMGKMGDPEYRVKNMTKIEEYVAEGLTPGKDLILTFECSEKALSTKVINKIIKELFL